MLPVGITLMVASIVVGVVALTLVALTSSWARSAARRTRTAMALSDEEEADRYPRPHAGEAADAPRWAIAMMMISGAGLVLGLLMVMIGSLP